MRPMYHLHPTEQRAYEVPNQYAFGSELLVAPITTPRDPQSLHGSATAWLPPGTWTDLFTGDGVRRRTAAGACTGTTTSIPVLLPAGGIVTLAGPDDLDATTNPQALEVVLAPGADGSFTLLEDDGTGSTPDDIPCPRPAWSGTRPEGCSRSRRRTGRPASCRRRARGS